MSISTIAREHLVASAAYWFGASRLAQDAKDYSLAIHAMENAYNHVENALAAERAAQAENVAEIARLQAALEYVRDNGQLARHGHWDPEGTHGAHCSICCAQRDTAARVREALNRIEVKSCPPDTRSAATASVASPEPQPGSNAAPSEVPPSAEAAIGEHMNPMSNTVRLQQNEIVTLRAEVDRLTKENAVYLSNSCNARTWLSVTTDRDRLAAELENAKAAVEPAFREGYGGASPDSGVDAAWLASDARRLSCIVCGASLSSLEIDAANRRCTELEKERDALLAVINRLEARAVAAEADNLRLANDLAITRISRNAAAELKLEAQRRAERAEEALREIWQLIDNGTLCRDISGDGDPAWATKAARLVAVLQRARTALAEPALDAKEGA